MSKDFITFEIKHELKDLKEAREVLRKYLFGGTKGKLPSGIISVQLIENTVNIPLREYNDYKKSDQRMKLVTEKILKEKKSRKRRYNTKKEQLRDKDERRKLDQQMEYGKVLKCMYCGRANFKSLSGLGRHQKRCKEKNA